MGHRSSPVLALARVDIFKKHTCSWILFLLISLSLSLSPPPPPASEKKPRDDSSRTEILRSSTFCCSFVMPTCAWLWLGRVCDYFEYAVPENECTTVTSYLRRVESNAPLECFLQVLGALALVYCRPPSSPRLCRSYNFRLSLQALASHVGWPISITREARGWVVQLKRGMIFLTLLLIGCTPTTINENEFRLICQIPDWLTK